MSVKAVPDDSGTLSVLVTDPLLADTLQESVADFIAEVDAGEPFVVVAYITQDTGQTTQGPNLVDQEVPSFDPIQEPPVRTTPDKQSPVLVQKIVTKDQIRKIEAINNDIDKVNLLIRYYRYQRLNEYAEYEKWRLDQAPTNPNPLILVWWKEWYDLKTLADAGKLPKPDLVIPDNALERFREVKVETDKEEDTKDLEEDHPPEPETPE